MTGRPSAGPGPASAPDPHHALAAGPGALDAAVLRIRDPRGRAVGLGFLIGPGLALTCAHVVAAALGLPPDSVPGPAARIAVDLPLLRRPGDCPGVTAEVRDFLSPGPSGAGDIAVLRLTAPLPGARPVRLVEDPEVWEHPVRVFGFPAGRPDGVWHAGLLRARQAGGWVQADLSGQGYAVSRGFSGSPVWDDRLSGVVGMMVQAEAGEPPVSYLIPADRLLAPWPDLRELALPRSPFRGLAAFREEDADVFHGREEESRIIAEALAGRRWVTVVGSSGSGKSSLALAGVVPRRRAAGDAVAVLRPTAGSSPLSALAAALLPLLEPDLTGTERLARIPVLAALLADGALGDLAEGLATSPPGGAPPHPARRDPLSRPEPPPPVTAAPGTAHGPPAPPTTPEPAATPPPQAAPGSAADSGSPPGADSGSAPALPETRAPGIPADPLPSVPLHGAGLPAPRRTARSGGGGSPRRLLIVVDQFEELLSVPDPAAVDALARVLFHDALPPSVHVLTTLRADFLEAVLDRPALGRFVGRSLYALGPLGPEGLRRAVTAPVDAVPGVRYEPHLAERILADTGDEPGALPLLGFALDQLWQHQSGGLLTHRAYGELGGVAGALSARAEEIWRSRVPAEDGPPSRRLLTRLVRIPLGSAAATRRTVSLTELGPDERRIARALADADARLLVTGRTAEGTETVELAHEALITGWDRLAAQAARDHSFLAWREQLRHDLGRWERSGRNPELLPAADTLAGARPWLESRGPEFSPEEHEFLREGGSRQRARTRNRRVLRTAGGVLLALALVLGTLYAYASGQARGRAALAASRALAQAAQDQTGTDPARAAMLAVAAHRTAPTDEARNQLLRQYLANADADRVLSGLPAQIDHFAASRDGEVVLARSTSGRAVLFVHAATGTVRTELLRASQVIAVHVVPDGSRAAYVTYDGTGGWFEVRADAGRIAGPEHRLPRIPDTSRFGDPGRGTAVSADGSRLAVIGSGRIAWWDLGRDEVGGSTPLPGDPDGALWFGPDHRTLYAGLWQGPALDDGHRLLALPPDGGTPREVVTRARSFLPSGDRTTAVVCRKEGTTGVFGRVRLPGGTPDPVRHRSAGGCDQDAVDLTGRRFLVREDGAFGLVDLDRGTVVARAGIRPGTASTSVYLLARGEELYVAAKGEETSWIALTRILPQRQWVDVGQQRLTRDGRRTVTVLKDGSAVELRPADPADGRLLAREPRPKPHFEPRRDSRFPFGRDGTLFADRDGVNTVTVRETATLRPRVRITTAKPPEAASFGYLFHRDGRLVTAAGTLIQQWDPRSGRELARFDVKDFLPPGRSIATTLVHTAAHPDRDRVSVMVQGTARARVVDLGTGRTVAEVPVAEDVIGVQFAPRGGHLALLRSGGVVELWRRDPLRLEIGPLPSVADAPGQQFVATFLDDGRYVVAAHSTVRTYRPGARTPPDSWDFGQLQNPYGRPSGFEFMDLSGDARSVIYIDPQRNGGPLRLDPADWERKLCRIIGHRAFTPDERRTLPVPAPDGPVCPPP